MLVRNVGIRGKHKLANRWEHTPYIVKEQPNPDIPVYVVQQEGSKKKPRILNRNLLLPFMGLPRPDQTQSSDQSTRAEDILQPDPIAIDIVKVPEESPVSSSREDSEIDSEVDTQSQSEYESSSDAESLPPDRPGKYIIPACRQPGQSQAPRRLSMGDQHSSSDSENHLRCKMMTG